MSTAEVSTDLASAADAGTAASPRWCERCGKPVAKTALNVTEHATCLAAQLLEPPRYCPGCGRRMKVQVLPDGWRAVCVEHGTRESVAGS
ncbi:MAG: hypothetical protein ACRDPW_00440 [Mycobacteriales bacterium]